MLWFLVKASSIVVRPRLCVILLLSQDLYTNNLYENSTSFLYCMGCCARSFHAIHTLENFLVLLSMLYVVIALFKVGSPNKDTKSLLCLRLWSPSRSLTSIELEDDSKHQSLAC